MVAKDAFVLRGAFSSRGSAFIRQALHGSVDELSLELLGGRRAAASSAASSVGENKETNQSAQNKLFKNVFYHILPDILSLKDWGGSTANKIYYAIFLTPMEALDLYPE